MIPEDIFDALKKTAITESAAWSRLEASLRDEEQALRRQELAEITKSTIRKEMAISGVQIAAENRRKLLSNIGMRLGLMPSPVMEHLFPLASGEQRQEMTTWQAKFAVCGKTISSLNRQNMDAIKTSLTIVSDSLTFLNNITATLPSYTPGGQISAHTLQGRIVSKRG